MAESHNSSDFDVEKKDYTTTMMTGTSATEAEIDPAAKFANSSEYNH